MDTDPVIVTEDAPAEQEGVSCLIISCDASFAYASIKFFFCGQMWPMASRRVAVTPRLSFLLVGLLGDLGASRRRLGLRFLGLITHGLGVALRLSGGLMGGTRTESQANRQDQKEDGEAGADDRQNFHAAVGP